MAYNSKNNSKNNNSYNFGILERSDICPRLRILFVSFFGSDFLKMCAIPCGSGRKKNKKGSRDGFPFCVLVKRLIFAAT